MQSLEKQHIHTLCFHVTNVEQLKRVREFVYEVGFQLIRDGENPIEIFTSIQTEMFMSLMSILTTGSDDITVELNLFE